MNIVCKDCGEPFEPTGGIYDKIRENAARHGRKAQEPKVCPCCLWRAISYRCDDWRLDNNPKTEEEDTMKERYYDTEERRWLELEKMASHYHPAGVCVAHVDAYGLLPHESAGRLMQSSVGGPDAMVCLVDLHFCKYCGCVYAVTSAEPCSNESTNGKGVVQMPNEELWHLAVSMWNIQHLLPHPDDVSADDDAESIRMFNRALRNILNAFNRASVGNKP